MTYKEVLDGNYKLVFKHSVQIPTVSPDMEINTFKLWVVEDGFICVSPMRSFQFGNSRFIFKYPVSGNAYLCTFDEIEPKGYRTPRNSGTVQISTNKKPVPIKQAIGILWKELNKALKYYSRINPRTRIVSGYISNRIFEAIGGFKPSHVYNLSVYVLYIDYTGLKAEYKQLISQEDILKIYKFVSALNGIGWAKSFGFTKEEFLYLLENSDK